MDAAKVLRNAKVTLVVTNSRFYCWKFAFCDVKKGAMTPPPGPQKGLCFNLLPPKQEMKRNDVQWRVETTVSLDFSGRELTFR